MKTMLREKGRGAVASGEALFWVVGKNISEEVAFEWNLNCWGAGHATVCGKVNGQSYKKWNYAVK